MDRSRIDAHVPRRYVRFGVRARRNTPRLECCWVVICSVLFRVDLLPGKLRAHLLSSDLTYLSRFQCIFTLGTKNLGVYTKRGSGLIVMVRNSIFCSCSFALD